MRDKRFSGEFRFSDQFKDEVYRQMFRLEAHHPGAETDLAVALLRTFVVAYSAGRSKKERLWFRKICPICLAMIEAAIRAADARRQSIQ
jgi:hypothetical protein